MSNLVTEIVDGTLTIASTGTLVTAGTWNQAVGTLKLTSATPGVQWQVNGAGNTYTLSSAVNPANPTTISLVDPGRTTCKLITDNCSVAALQATSNTTTVTCNARAGVITMSGAEVANGISTFTLNNNFITTNSVVVATVNALTAVAFQPVVVGISALLAGSVNITVHNTDGANATSAAPIINFIVL